MKPVLLSSEDMLNPNIVDSWVIQQFQVFREQIIHKDYPCFFATSSEQCEEIRYTYINAPEELSVLVDALKTFIDLALSAPAQSRFAFVAFFKPEQDKKSLQYYGQQFWKTLQFLHEHDKKPWSSHISPDPNHIDFEFCFGGEPIFVFGGAPTYINRKSRNLCDSFVLVFVPYTSFHGVKISSQEGIKATKKIRERLVNWDNCAVYKEFGEAHIKPYAWKAYFIPDDDSPIYEECPFKVLSADN